MRRLLLPVLAATAVLGCQVPPGSQVLYRCEPTGTCAQAADACWSDGFCHPASDGVDPRDGGGTGGSTGGGGGGVGGAVGGGAGGGAGGSEDAGSDAGSGLDAGVDAGDVSDAGTDAGSTADAGLDAGVDAGPVCMPVGSCPGTAVCGRFDAGCGQLLDCGTCSAPEECGVIAANTCALPRLCAQGFCWENPLPQGNWLRSAFAFGPRAVWAVGDVGTVLFWNGERTQLVDVGTTAGLRGVHGSAPNDLYVVGDVGTIVHWDGATWTRETTPAIYRINVVWAAGSGLAFAGANGGYILKRDAVGGTWSEMSFTGVGSTTDILGLWGLASGEVFATSLARTFRLPTRSASAWAADTDWTGTPRDTIALGGTPAQLFLGGKVSALDAGVLLQRQPDGGWSTFGARVARGFFSVVAERPDEAWVSGPAGMVTRLFADGGVEAYAFSRDAGLTALAVTGSGAVFAGGELGTMGLASGGVERELSYGSTVNINAVCGYAEARAYAPADAQLVYERRSTAQGVRWDAVLRQATPVSRWLSCFAQGPDQVWVVGDDKWFLRQSGGVFQTGDTGQVTNWVGVWGQASGPWYFVGESRRVHSTTTGDAPTNTGADTANTPSGIFGVADNDLYIVGVNSSFRRRASGWYDEGVPGSQYSRALKAVHATKYPDGGALFSVVGYDTAWRRVNGTWIADTIPPGNALRATYVTPTGEIWAGGDDGGTAVLWRNGLDGGWAPQPLTALRPITGMGGFGDVGPFVVGQGGTILRHVGLDGG